MAKNKKPYYGKKTKKQIVEEYLTTSASMDELAKLHGILGSNTIADWIKKYGNPPKLYSVKIFFFRSAAKLNPFLQRNVY